jgi:alpha-tubulin suppressor-like RCC1 family protein
MALTVTGELYCWGKGGGGQLGHGGTESLAVPRVVDGVEGAVAGMAGGTAHSLVTTIDGRVLAFGRNGTEDYEDSDGEELDEPVFVVDGRLGLGVGVAEALTPTAIDGIVIGREGEEGAEGKEGKD